MRRLAAILMAATIAGCGQPGAPTPDAGVLAAAQKPAAPNDRAAIRAEDLAAHIRTLSSDAFEGRGATDQSDATHRE